MINHTMIMVPSASTIILGLQVLQLTNETTRSENVGGACRTNTAQCSLINNTVKIYSSYYCHKNVL